MPAEAHVADLVNLIRIDTRIFGVEMDNLFAKIADAADGVDVLPYQMGWIEIQSKMWTVDGVEHGGPHGRRRGEISAAWPFIFRKQHGTIFDADRHTLFFRVV